MEQQEQQQYNGVITKKLQLTKTVYQFVINNIDPKELHFAPGQYAAFIIDEKTRRQYSFCSAPNPISFELVVDVSPLGPGSKYFLEKKEGDRAEYLAPLGNFTLQESVRKKIFVATGTGIAPFRSMLYDMSSRAKRGDLYSKDCFVPQSGTRNDIDISLYWGLRYEEDIYWKDELEALARQYKGFEFNSVLSKPSASWSGLTGHVTEQVFQRELDMASSDFYICGNRYMITEVVSGLKARRVLGESIKTDMFY